MSKAKILWLIRSRGKSRAKAKQQRDIDKIGGMSMHSRGIYERDNKAC